MYFEWYGLGDSQAYHRDRANHWHVTAQTLVKSKKARIAAVMAVYDRDDQFTVQLKHMNDWFGVIATGDFGQVEGWIRTGEIGSTRPSSFAKDNIERQIDLWGRSRDGDVFFA